MKYILLGMIVLLPCNLAFPIDYEFREFVPKPRVNWNEYLDRFFPCHDKEVNRTIQERIAAMQNFFHLKVTGELDEETEAVMEQPRCGVPDVLEYNTLPNRPKWGKNDLTYRIKNYTPDMPQAKVNEAIAHGLQVWADVTPLQFTEVEEAGKPVDIEILFARRAHGDSGPFDGKNGVLAHAYGPGGGIGGDVHFDEDEKWSEINKDINLFVVTAHEIGHSLGLDHSSDRSALMYPTYSYVNPVNYKLPMDDVKGIQSLYGPKPTK